MKAVNIQIRADNVGQRFKCNITIDQLEREDCTHYERILANDVEQIVTRWVEQMVNVIEVEDGSTTFKQEKI